MNIDELRPDPYDVCPIYESENFLLRVVSVDDVEDLLECYSDIAVRNLFNNDNCPDWFFNGESDEIRELIESWLKDYKDRRFVRFSIIDKRKGKAVGTMEIFDGDDEKYIKNRKGHSVLRIDIMTRYENEKCLSELLKISDTFFNDFGCKKIVSKVTPKAVQRITAFIHNGYAPYLKNDEWTRNDYYIKKAPL